jgi:subtilisin family serine protease
MSMGGISLRVAVVFLLVIAPLSPLLMTDTATTSGDTPDAISVLEARNGLLARDRPDAPEPAPAVDHEVLVILELKRGATLPADVGMEVEDVYTRRGATHLQGYVPLTDVRDLSTDPRIEAVRIERERLAEDGAVAPGVAEVGADALHARGVRGQNVTVGIIDSGFRLSDPEIAGHVTAYRSFDGDRDEWVHGTAVASVVADTAPDANIHLAAIGTSTTPEEYAAAIAWLKASGADVIVDSGSYFGQPRDGSGRLDAIATEAAEDTLFVTSAGNYAERHWAGTHNASGPWVEFAPGTEGNKLNGGEPFSGRVQASLRWDDWPTTDADYDLYLLRERAGKDEVIARSVTRQRGASPTEHIDATVPHGRYYLAIKPHNVTGHHDLSLFASESLAHSTPAGSLTAPGTAPGVLTVGAADNGSVRAFSSQGPVGGDPGVDLVAPDSVAYDVATSGGTSYSAPYVAGTAALVKSRYPDLTAAQLRGILRTSARDVGEPGVDPATGYGIIDARGATALAGAYVRYAPVNETT